MAPGYRTKITSLDAAAAKAPAERSGNSFQCKVNLFASQKQKGEDSIPSAEH
jgi:hypothetical protein